MAKKKQEENRLVFSEKGSNTIAYMQRMDRYREASLLRKDSESKKIDTSVEDDYSENSFPDSEANL